MRELLIGEYIKSRRLDLGMTQDQLCEGICTPATLSRLENNTQTPGRNRINALLQRLGLPDDRYFALLSKNEEEVESLQKEIQIDCVRFRRAAETNRPQIRASALAKIEQLERIIEKDDQIARQYILSMKVALGKPEGQYSFGERLDMLMQAIRLTVPRFDLEDIGHFRYSMDEVRLINQIARTYSNAGQRKKAIDIYSQLLKFIEKCGTRLPSFAGRFCLVSQNYAIDLGLEKRYEDAISIASRGQAVCAEYGHYQFLPSFLAIQAECFFFTENRAKSAECYSQAYYIYKAIGDETNLAVIKKEMKDHLGLELLY